MAFENGTAYPESDADDEYERSMHAGSPVLATDDEEERGSSEDEDGEEGERERERTPTTAYGERGGGGQLPETIVTEWTAGECADFVGSLGLGQYGGQFLENEITGESLVALLHEDLKQMGVASVGHRLTILKTVYEIKIKQDIPVDSDHYVPLSADAEAQYATATLKDIRQLVEQLRLRDERMSIAEAEMRKITDEYRRLREDLLPVFRMAKEGQPLPYHPTPPNQAPYSQQYAYEPVTISPPVPAPTPSAGLSGGGLSRKFSTKQFFLGSTPKNSSPTHLQQSAVLEQALDPSAAAERAVLASAHLAAMSGAQPQTSPGLSPNIPSPTSPPHQQKTLSGSTLASRSYRNDLTPGRATFAGSESDTLAASYQYARDSRDILKPPGSGGPRRAPTPGFEARVGAPGAPGGASVEIFKSFRVSMEDMCWKVLIAARKKYNITDPAERCALYIVFGDQERCLELDEKPLILFKQLDKEGRLPMFMLRKMGVSADGSVAPELLMAANGGLLDGARTPMRNASQRAPQRGAPYEPPGGII